MDSWLKAKADKLAQAAQQHVSDLQQSATQLTQGALEGALQRTGVLADDTQAREKKDLQFGSGALGFRLEGTLVVAVEEGRQAATLGLEVGDRLVAVDGYVVPDFEPGDLEGEQRAKRLIKKWMKEMPRPATLTFRPLTPGSGGEPEDKEEAAAEAALPNGGQSAVEVSEPRAPSPTDEVASHTEEGSWVPLDISFSDLACAAPDAPSPPPTNDEAPVADASPADATDETFEVGEVAEEGSFEAECTVGEGLEEVAEASPAGEALPPELLSGKVQDLQAALQHERGENRKLGVALQEARQAFAQARSSWEAEQQQRASLQKRVVELQKREKVLADEVTRLGQALQTAVPQSTETAMQKAAAAEAQVVELQEAVARLTKELEDLRERSEAAEGRADAAEAEVGQLRPQLERFSHVHDAELELLRSEHLEEARRRREDFEGRLAALEEKAARELEQARRETREALELSERHRAAAEEASVEVQAAAVEARAARLAEADVREKLDAVTGGDRGGSDGPEEGSDDEVLHKAVSAPEVGSRGHEESSVLYARIELLEARCSKLQQRLRAQRGRVGTGDVEAAESGAQGSGAPADWEARLASSLGPRAAGVLVLMHGLMDMALRGFTQRLLKHALWLYVFYAHLLVLYAISASCYAQSGMYSEAPLDSISEGISTAASASPRDAG